MGHYVPCMEEGAHLSVRTVWMESIPSHSFRILSIHSSAAVSTHWVALRPTEPPAGESQSWYIQFIQLSMSFVQGFICMAKKGSPKFFKALTFKTCIILIFFIFYKNIFWKTKNIAARFVSKMKLGWGAKRLIDSFTESDIFELFSETDTRHTQTPLMSAAIGSRDATLTAFLNFYSTSLSLLITFP